MSYLVLRWLIIPVVIAVVQVAWSILTDLSVLIPMLLSEDAERRSTAVRIVCERVSTVLYAVVVGVDLALAAQPSVAMEIRLVFGGVGILVILLILAVSRAQSSRQRNVLQWEVDAVLAKMRGQQLRERPKSGVHSAELALWGVTACNTLGVLTFYATL